MALTAKKAAKGRMLISRIMNYEGQRKRDDSSFDSGFTLLELLTVIFIVSLLVAIIFPLFHGVEVKKLKSDARRIASVLRYLNDNAIATKETCSLKFDFRARTVSWKCPGLEKTEGFRSLASLELQSRGEINDGQVTVFFGPLGIQESIVINFNDNNERMKVTFNQVSGRAKIIERQSEKANNNETKNLQS